VFTSGGRAGPAVLHLRLAHRRDVCRAVRAGRLQGRADDNRSHHIPAVPDMHQERVHAQRKHAYANGTLLTLIDNTQVAMLHITSCSSTQT